MHVYDDVMMFPQRLYTQLLAKHQGIHDSPRAGCSSDPTQSHTLLAHLVYLLMFCWLCDYLYIRDGLLMSRYGTGT